MKRAWSKESNVQVSKRHTLQTCFKMNDAEINGGIEVV